MCLVYICHRSANIQEFYPYVTSLSQLATERIKWRHVSKKEEEEEADETFFFLKHNISLSHTWSSSDGKCYIHPPFLPFFTLKEFRWTMDRNECKRCES